MLKVCKHDFVRATSENFANFTSYVQLGTEMNSPVFEVKRSKVMVMTRQNMWSKITYSNMHPSSKGIPIEGS